MQRHKAIPIFRTAISFTYPTSKNTSSIPITAFNAVCLFGTRIASQQILTIASDNDYTSKKLTHLDLWIGPSTSGNIACELDFGTISSQTIIQNPPSNLPVNSGALWDGSACHDASSSNPFVYPDPSSSGLCSGGAPLSVGSPIGQSTSATPLSSLTAHPVVSSTSSALSLSLTVQPPPSSSASQAALPSSIALSSASITLQTSVSTSSSSSVVEPTATSSANDTSNCASWGGCLGNDSLFHTKAVFISTDVHKVIHVIRTMTVLATGFAWGLQGRAMTIGQIRIMMFDYEAQEF